MELQDTDIRCGLILLRLCIEVFGSFLTVGYRVVRLPSVSGIPSLIPCGDSWYSHSRMQQMRYQLCRQRVFFVCLIFSVVPCHTPTNNYFSQISSIIPRIQAGWARIFSQVSIPNHSNLKYSNMATSCVLLNPEFSGSPIVKDFLFGRTS